MHLLVHPGACGFILPVDSSDACGELSHLAPTTASSSKICASTQLSAAAGGCCNSRRYTAAPLIVRSICTWLSACQPPPQSKGICRGTELIQAQIKRIGEAHVTTRLATDFSCATHQIQPNITKMTRARHLHIHRLQNITSWIMKLGSSPLYPPH